MISKFNLGRLVLTHSKIVSRNRLLKLHLKRNKPRKLIQTTNTVTKTSTIKNVSIFSQFLLNILIVILLCNTYQNKCMCFQTRCLFLYDYNTHDILVVKTMLVLWIFQWKRQSAAHVNIATPNFR